MEAASAEERELRREALRAERAELATEESRQDDEIALLRDLSEDCKRRRVEMKTQGKELDETYGELVANLNTATEDCAALQANLDAGYRRLQQRRLPARALREGDADVNEERRKIRAGARPADRSRQLHEALAAALQQEGESSREKVQRESVLKQVEEELKELRRSDDQLRREIDDLRSLELSQLSSSQVSSQTPSMPASAASSAATSHAVASAASSASPHGPDAPEGERPATARGAARKEVAVEVATPHGAAGLVLGVAAADDDEDLLYGGAPSSRPARASARAGLFSNAPPAGRASAVPAASGSGRTGGGGKWGALFGSAAASGRGGEGGGAQLAKVSTAPTPPLRRAVSKGGAMQTLFANRKT